MAPNAHEILPREKHVHETSWIPGKTRWRPDWNEIQPLKNWLLAAADEEEEEQEEEEEDDYGLH